MRTRGGSSGQIAAWLLRLVLVVGAVGFVVVEAGAVLLNRLQASDVAADAASEAAVAFRDTGSVDAAFQRAQEYATSKGVRFVDLRIDPQAREARVTVERTAATRVVQRIGALRRYTKVRVTEAAPIPR